MKKMGKKLILGTAFAVASVAAAGCGSAPPSVYGPPPEATEEPSSDTLLPPETEYDPGVNIPEAVYGPPPDETINSSEYFDPSTEVNEDVYGPPEWFE